MSRRNTNGFDSRTDRQIELKMYVIVKYVKNNKGVELPVIIIDTMSEVLEFETYEEAEKIRDLMSNNSDSGHRYVVKKL